MTTELETNIVAYLYIYPYSRSSSERNIHKLLQRMTTELETNIVAVERVKEYTETPTEVNRVVSENDNRVRDKHCSCRKSEGIHRNSYRGVVSEGMTTELETNIVAVVVQKLRNSSYFIYIRVQRQTELANIVERVKEYTETPTEVNSSYFIYIPTQGVVSENDNRVRDKHCSCRKSEGIHRNSYRGVVSENDNRVRDKHCSCRESEGIHKTPTERESEGIHRNSYRGKWFLFYIYIPTQGVVSENDNRVRDKHCSCRESEEYTETPTERSSYFIYIPTQGVVSENDNRVRDKHCSCRKSEGIHRNSYRGVVSENDNRVRDKHCSCRESEGIHRNSYRGVVSENDSRVRDKHCSCRKSEGIHRNSYREVKFLLYISYSRVVMRMTTELETNIVAERVVSENDNRVRDKHCSCRIHRNSYRVKEYTETQTSRRSISENDNRVRDKHCSKEGIVRGVVSENDNRVRDKHCSCRKSEGIHRNSYRGVVSENDNRVRDKHCSCRESEGIHRNSYRGVVSENDNRVRDKHCSCRESEGIHRNSYRELETNIVAVERVKEYTETPTEVNSSYFIYIPTQGVVSENDNRVRDKHCSCRESEGINSYRGK
ncbi:unnamed protein product [Mytilus edulis]|uniref:Uncharacterized protein n=1 Tax=Mytilus edulis TaxID=6550 RepID=A0A8S3TEP7_MYTED|nr:unnamed protein product [Mytilus edulis]